MTTTTPFSYAIRRSTRATKVRIIVTINKIEVVAPLKTAAGVGGSCGIHNDIQINALLIIAPPRCA